MPPDPAPTAGCGLGERLPTVPAALGHHGHDLVHLLDRQQRAAGPAVSRLAAALPAGRRRFRPRWCLGRVRRGGTQELDEFWPRRASSSRMRSRRAKISAWAAAGVTAQISGGRGKAVASMTRGIRRHRASRKRGAPGGPERLLSPYPDERPPQIALRSRGPTSHTHRRCHPPRTSLESARATRAGAAVPGAAAPAPTRRGFPAPGATCVRSASHRPAEPRLKRRLQDTLLCGPARRLDVPVGKHGTRRPRRADDGSVSRAPATQARPPPARSVGRGAATPPSARSPRARGSLTFPKRPKRPPGEDRFVFLRNGPLPGAATTAIAPRRSAGRSPQYWGAGGAASARPPSFAGKGGGGLGPPGLGHRHHC